jgi:formylmethanofuran dehydrogenase subunit B
LNEPGETGRRIIEDVACPGCELVCDDLSLVVEGERITEVRGGCERGNAWYEGSGESRDEGPTILGTPARLDAAIDRAAALLASAKSPVVWGLAGASIEAQRVAVAIADRIGAVIGIEGDDPEGLRAFQRIGEVSASFGEIKDRADLIVYDAADSPRIPARFRERFADDATGRFVPDGRTGRTVVWLGPIGFAESCTPDLVVEVAAANQVAFYAALRALVLGVSLDAGTVERATGVPLRSLVELTDRLKRATYGAFVLHASTKPVETEVKLALVRDLNAHTRFVAVHAGGSHVNSAGAKSVLAWQAGAAGDVDFGRGYPRHVPRDGVRERVGRCEVDAALIVSDTALPGGDDLSFPCVLIHDGGSRSPLDHAVEVRFPTARLGVDEGGSVARADGVMLPLRPPFPGRKTTQVEVLRAIEAKIKDQTR